MTDARSRSEYYRTYYEDHRTDLSEKRRDRYQNDPEYREKAKEDARRYRQRKKAEREQLRAEGKLPPARPKGPRKPIEVEVNGSKALAHTITVAADRIGRSVDTLNHWSKVGLLPATPIRSQRGDRLFTDGMILVVRMAVMKRGEVSVKDPTFKEEIEDGWRGLGVEI